VSAMPTWRSLVFTDRDPIGPYLRSRPDPAGDGLREHHRSGVPIVVQHTRLDSRQAENALITTVAFPGTA